MGSRREHEGSRDDETSFRMLCETCGVGFWHVDREGKSVYLNPTMCELLEVRSREEIGDLPYHRFFAPESLPRMELEHAKRPTGMPSTYEVELRGMRGGRRNVVISGAPVTDASGALSGLIGTFTDITARKRAEVEREESEQRLSSVFSASVDAIGVARAGRHVMVNPAYVRMFGYESADGLMGRSILELIAPAEHERIIEFVRQRMQGENLPHHYLTRGLRRNGEEFPLAVHASHYEQEGEIYSVAILRDLTEQMQLEEQLRQAQKMDALGRLSGGVAHDFNNMLMVLWSCADLILAAPENAAMVTSNADLIRKTCERAVGLTRQLLALSRHQVIDPTVIDLNAVVTEMGEMLRRLIGPRVDLRVTEDKALRRVRADSAQLQQVLLNLCVNARDALHGTGQIRIATRNVELGDAEVRAMPGMSPGRFVLLQVSDDGIGMDAATQERVFEPFFTTKAVGQGTGLGLSTVYGIVKQSGGHIAVSSALGSGSTFSIHLPAVESPLSERTVQEPARVGKSTGTVLVVEDERSVRELVQGFLQSLGYRVVTAADGPDGLIALARERGSIDIVVTDLLMPGMSGAELARELDRLAPGLPILFMSGYAHDDGATILASRPRCGFLPKPFSLKQIAAEIERLMSQPA